MISPTNTVVLYLQLENLVTAKKQLGVRPLNYIVTSIRCYGCHFEWTHTVVRRILVMKYYDDLDATAQRRYRQKLKIAGLASDPYSSKDFTTATTGDRSLWPQMEYLDIYNYLINALHTQKSN